VTEGTSSGKLEGNLKKETKEGKVGKKRKIPRGSKWSIKRKPEPSDQKNGHKNGQTTGIFHTLITEEAHFGHSVHRSMNSKVPKGAKSQKPSLKKRTQRDIREIRESRPRARGPPVCSPQHSKSEFQFRNSSHRGRKRKKRRKKVCSEKAELKTAPEGNHAGSVRGPNGPAD